MIDTDVILLTVIIIFDLVKIYQMEKIHKVCNKK